MCLGSNFSELKSDLNHFKVLNKFFKIITFFYCIKNAFDREECLEKGSIIPHKGVFPEFDTQMDHVDTCEEAFDGYLEKEKRKLKYSVS
jgi:hypothetical protein